MALPHATATLKKNRMAKETKEKEPKQPMPPIGAWGPAVALGWLIPGAGHLLLKKTGRGVLLLLAVTGMFLCGLMMRGAMFHPQSGDLLTTLINTGGFVGDLCSGMLYLLSVWLGYTQPDMAGAVHDYGTKFLVTAGLLNLLAIVDVFEIAAGRKD
jgi:TM2 domain-containing membrane protein YozV